VGNPTPGEAVISEFDLMGAFQTCFEKEKRMKGKQPRHRCGD
jgi:hypothetical protein